MSFVGRGDLRGECGANGLWFCFVLEAIAFEATTASNEGWGGGGHGEGEESMN